MGWCFISLENKGNIVETSWYEAEIKSPSMTQTEKAESLEILESKVFGIRKNLMGEVIPKPDEVRIYAIHEVKRLLYVKKK